MRSLRTRLIALWALLAASALVMGFLLLMNKLAFLSAGLTQLVPGWPSPTL